MTPEKCKQLYNDNPDFRQYVDNFFRSKAIKMDDGAFRLKIIQNVGESYLVKPKGSSGVQEVAREYQKNDRTNNPV